MLLPRWFTRRFLVPAFVVVVASGVTPAAAQTDSGADDRFSSPAVLIQENPFGDELATTVDLCDDSGAATWGLDEGDLDAERARLGIVCGDTPIIGHIDMFGESTVNAGGLGIPAPSRASAAPVEGVPVDAAAQDAEPGFFDTVLGYYTTAPPTRRPRDAEPAVGVVAASLSTDHQTVRGLVTNTSEHLAKDVTITLGSSRASLAIGIQPGEEAGFVITNVAVEDLTGDLAEAITVSARFSEAPDFGRAIALSETFASSPERPEVLVTTAVPDNRALPVEFEDGFAITNVSAVVTSLDARGRVLDVSEVALLGDLGPGASGGLEETDRIDATLGMQVVRASTPGAAAVVINVGGTPIVRAAAERAASADLSGLAAEAAYDSIEVTRGTYRGVLGAIDTLFARGRGCPEVSKAELASVLFAIPAHELAGWQPPSPASFSRSDNMAVDTRNERLYSFARNNGRAARAFWAPGIGIYQLDTLNLRFGAFAKANTRRATLLVGRMLVNRWCDGGVDAMRSFLANTWFACANDACYQTSQALYDEASDGLRGVSTSGGNSVTGGVKNRFCWSPDRPDVYVRCRFFDISRLQGEMNMIALDGGAGPNPYTPVPADFVELTIPTANGPAEARVFMTGNTGYAREIWAIRPLGTNPRTSLRWFSQTWASFKGDLSVWSCPQLGDSRPSCSWSTTTAR